jgi:glycosyltransferase involved in cell wall biosynthesis
MKIIYVSPFPPARDGIGTYTRAFVDAMTDQGHEARVITPRAHPDSPQEVIGAIGSGSGQLTALHDVVMKWQPDVVHVQFAIAAFGARTRRLLQSLRIVHSDLGVPTAVTMHEVTRDTALMKSAGRAIYRRVADHCEKIIVHTGGAADALTGTVGVPASKVIVIPHPRTRVPATGSTPSELRAHFGLGSTRILLAFGFIHVDKGLGDLVRAIGLLRTSATVPLDDIRLVVAGAVRPRDGLFRAFAVRDRAHLWRVIRRARHEGTKQQLVMTGYVPDGDIAGWFLAADAVVLPYRRTEQSGVAGLADAFGVPVLASTAGGLGEYFAGSPWIFPPGNPESLAKVLADFLGVPPEQRRYEVPHLRSADLAEVVTATLNVYHAVQHGGLKVSNAVIGDSDMAIQGKAVAAEDEIYGD